MSTAADAKVVLAYLMEHCGIPSAAGEGAGTGGDPGTGESRESSLFRRIRGLEDAERIISLIGKELTIARRYTIGRLLDGGVTEADGYRLEEVRETITSVDAAKLFREEPELYEKIARIPAHILVKELGHDRLRSMLIEAKGPDAARRYDTISVEDLDAVFSSAEDAAPYKRTISYPAGYAVRETGGGEAGRAEAGAKGAAL
ncbi:MAG: hypothetical protein MJ005_06110 [Methanocorpusculum sp.]|nr:hypothetical protein [Methanocorpusculum sp.]